MCFHCIYIKIYIIDLLKRFPFIPNFPSFTVSRNKSKNSSLCIKLTPSRCPCKCYTTSTVCQLACQLLYCFSSARKQVFVPFMNCRLPTNPLAPIRAAWTKCKLCYSVELFSTHSPVREVRAADEAARTTRSFGRQFSFDALKHRCGLLSCTPALQRCRRAFGSWT